MFNADLALSVTITAISTLMSVGFMPMNLLIYSKFAFDADNEVIQSMDFIALLIALIVVISAIGFGLLASAMFHSYRFNIMANKLGSYAGVSLLAYSVFMSNAGGETSMWEHPWQFYLAVSLPCFVGLVSGSIITSFLNLNKPERV
jgi:predicted Na+-dependent transporter